MVDIIKNTYLSLLTSLGEKMESIKGIFDTREKNLSTFIWIINTMGQILVQKRASTKKKAPNIWSLTGGVVEIGETSAQGCVREIKEEIGYDIDVRDIELFSNCCIKEYIFDAYVVIRDFSLSEAILCEDEVSEIKWVSTDEVKNMYVKGEFKPYNIDDLEKINEYIRKNIV
jgi:8-oxo-dGTP pyrophosphatase MutT (NUDIX family)